MGLPDPVLLWLPLAAFALPPEAALFAAVLDRGDINHDGTLSAAEYDAVDPAGEFAAVDADHDARVTPAELAEFVKHTQPRPPDRQRADSPGFGPAPAAAVEVPPTRPWRALALLVPVALGAAMLRGRRR